MRKKDRILIKLFAVVVLTILFIWLVYKDERVFQLTQPEGELAENGDVKILTGQLLKLGAQADDADALNRLLDRYFAEDTEYMQYHIYTELLDCLLGASGQSEESEDLKKSITYKDSYRDDFFVLKKDWYNSYRKLVKFYGFEDVLREEKIAILCAASDLMGDEKIEENCLLGKNKEVYNFQSEKFSGLRFTTVRTYIYENTLLTLMELLSDKGELDNVWIMEAEEGKIQFFYDGYEILADVQGLIEDFGRAREQVADITYKGGKPTKVKVKNERIGGKLLGIDEGQIEIEGHGKVPVKENYTGYMLYETLQKADKSELSIGYDFADFVLEDGKICAFLITKKEKMETIRVALKNDGFGSLYHDELKFVCQDDMTVYYGDYDNRKEEKIPAGQELVIDSGSSYLSGNRIRLVPAVNTGKIQVCSIKRSQGIPAYRGSMEILHTEDGFVLINEVLLEEYLYSVVPSEMPSSYPIEALKAQAVCARTYGYQYLKQPGYGMLGAHVDDSVGYQVYNNIAENINSTKAVKETAGILLLYEGRPATTYYYSTSCGFGTDAGIWNPEQVEKMPYLSAVHIAGQTENDREVFSPEELSREENFRSYITESDENAYEREEAWFRWSYQVKEFDAALMAERLMARYEAGAGKVLTYTGEGDPENDGEGFASIKPEKFKKVYGISALKRREGGVLDELLIETDKGIYKVISEYNIRNVLNQGGEIIRQDGSAYESASLLPSAYLIIDIEKDGKNGKDVVGYTIIGGGYGHGVGMSQNGARAMGMEDVNCENILSFYFKGCQLDKIY